MSSRCSWSTASIPTLYWGFHCNNAMVASSAEYEAAAIGAEVDDEHLVGTERQPGRALMVESVRPRGIAHADRHVVLADRQHEALVHARWAVAGEAGGRQRGAVGHPVVDIELDIKRAATARALLHAPHVRRQLCDLLRLQPPAIGLAVGAVDEAEHDAAGP